MAMVRVLVCSALIIVSAARFQKVFSPNITIDWPKVAKIGKNLYGKIANSEN